MAEVWSGNNTSAPGEGKLFLSDKMERSPSVRGAARMDLVEQVLRSPWFQHLEDRRGLIWTWAGGCCFILMGLPSRKLEDPKKVRVDS